MWEWPQALVDLKEQIFTTVNRMYKAYIDLIIRAKPKVEFDVESSVKAYQAKPEVDDEHEAGTETYSLEQ